MKAEFKTILFATDLSKNSAHAYQFAADLAEKYDAQIHVLHIIEKLPANMIQMMDFYVTEDMKKQMASKKGEIAEKLKKRVNVFCDKFQHENPQCKLRIASVQVYEGEPTEEILKKSSELKCDVLVMGTHGRGFLSHVFLGNIAQKVVQNSKIPVLLIPIPEKESELTVHDF